MRISIYINETSRWTKTRCLMISSINYLIHLNPIVPDIAFLDDKIS